MSQSKGLISLNNYAINQMEILKNNKNVKKLEVLQQQVNEDNKYLIESKYKVNEKSFVINNIIES